jgi:hypothetical protein
MSTKRPRDGDDIDVDSRSHGAKSASTKNISSDFASFAPSDRREPLTFACWNADGLLNRVRAAKHDDPRTIPRTKTALVEMVYRERPDIIALQEVWLKCAGGKGKGKGAVERTRCV